MLAWIYGHLSQREEDDSLRQFGEEYTRYAEATPAFIPRPGSFLNRYE